MSAHTVAPGTKEVGGRRAPDWMVPAIACVAQFMVVLDVPIVNVALPSIGRDLHFSSTGLQWVVNALRAHLRRVSAARRPSGRPVRSATGFLLGMFFFTAASLVGGVAQNSTWLTTSRALQGIGGAMISPATLTIIVTTFKGPQLTRALGAWGAVAGAGGAAGSLLGGMLAAELSWRWVLFVNIPIGIVAMAAATRYLTEQRARDEQLVRSLDIGGAITVTAGLGVLIYAIVGTHTHAWFSSFTLSLLGVAAALLSLFAVIEVQVASRPLVPFRLFRSRPVSGANAVMLLVGAAFFSMWFFLSLYLQTVLGYSPLRAGLAFLPMAIAVVVGAQASSRILPRSGSQPLLVAGSSLAAGGFLWLTQISAGGSYVGDVLGPGCVIALALGLLFTAAASAATAGVDPTEAGLASGVLNTSRQVGGSLGLAVLATVASDRAHSVLAAGHSVATTAAALTAGYASAFAGAAVLTLAALACAFVVPGTRDRHAGGDAASAGSYEPEGLDEMAVDFDLV